MDIVQTEITLTKIPSCKSSGFGTWQLSGVLLWFAPAGWWGIGQRQVCLPKDWLSSSSAPWKQKTKELAGTPFGHKVWRQRGSKGWGEEKKNTDTAFCFASQLWFYTFVTMREMQKTFHACAAFSAATSGWKWGRDPRAGGWEEVEGRRMISPRIAAACVCIIILRRLT